MNKTTSQMIVAVMVYLVVVAACAYGWITNIVHLVQYWGTETTLTAVLRIIGIVFAPLGVVLGYIW